jgi:sterol 3beta-glucosyltransferase
LVDTTNVEPEPLPRRKLTVRRLAQTIQQAVTDQTLRQRAADLGTKVRAEDGITLTGRVIQLIEKYGTTLPEQGR